MMQWLFDIFTEMGYGDLYFRQGSFANNEELPASFFTFWNTDTPELSFYDNKSRRYYELIQVCFYTSNADIIYSEMDRFIEKAKAAGLIVEKPTDAPSGKPSHSGRRVMIKKLHNNIGG